MPAPVRLDAGTASQPMPGVRPTAGLRSGTNAITVERVEV